MKEIIKLIRLNQCIKNLFIFTPVFFSMNLGHINMLFNDFVAFISFSFVSSSVYVFNDYFDVEEDKKHPQKRFRPLAADTVSKSTAKAHFVVLLIIGLLLLFFISVQALYVLLVYVVMNIAYTHKLKHIPILDLITIAIGFVLRIFVGAYAAGITLSLWIMTMTFFLALFLSLGKRRDDVLIFDATGRKMRRVIDGYNLKFIDISMILMSVVIIIAYMIYCFSDDVMNRMQCDEVYLTSIFVIIGIIRYMQVTFIEKKSGNPTEILLQDRIIQLNVVLWILSFMFILYF